MKRYLALVLALALLALLAPGVALADDSDWTFTTNETEATVTGYIGSAWNITIPATLGGKPVVAIGPAAFANNNVIEMVTIPTNVTSIGDNAFKSCAGLVSVTFQGDVTTIGNYVFYSSGLHRVNFSSNMSSIGHHMFARCANLTSVTIPGSVISIGTHAFEGSGLVSATISPGVKIIANTMFSLCTKLTSISIPDTVTGIGLSAFTGCTALTSITIPGSVKDIGPQAFESCGGLTSMTLPASVNNLGNWAFTGCTGLTSITIPDSVTSIGQNAFNRCTGLTSMTLPASVNNLGKQLFIECTNLSHLAVLNTALTEAQLGGGLDSAPKLTDIYGPSSGNVQSWATSKSLAFHEYYSDTPRLHNATIPAWTRGSTGDATLTATLDRGHYTGDITIPITATIGGQSVTRTATDDGPLSFTFTAAQLNQLAPGSYPIRFTSPDVVCNKPIDMELGTLTVQNPYTPPQDPRPSIGADATFTGTRAGGATIEVPFLYAGTDFKVELLVNGQTFQGQVGADGSATFDIPAGRLASGEHPLSIRSPGGSPLAETDIGKLTILYAPSLSGANALAVLPGHRGELSFAATLSGVDPENPVKLTLKLGAAETAPVDASNGALQLRGTLASGATGEVPVFASAPATDTNEAMPETQVGTITFLDKTSVLGGELAGKLDDGWHLVPIADGVWIAIKGEGLTVGKDGNLACAPGEGLDIATGWDSKAQPYGYLNKVHLSRFGVKAAQPVPAKLALKAEGTVSKSKKLAKFSFTAQEMARLEPGLYQFAIESSNLPCLTLATLLITAKDAQPVTWMIPQTLRVSVGQQYQLVKPLAEGNTLPELTVKTSNKRIATVTTGGVLTAKKAGTATISVKDKDGGTLKCKLTVVSNSYSRSRPLYVKGMPGLYTSTKRLYYEKGKLKAEVFVANTSGATVKNATGFVFELYDGEKLVYTRPVGPLAFTLKHKKYGVYKLTLTNDLLPGVSTKAFDLGSKRYQAVIRGDNAIPLIASSQGAVQANSTTFRSGGDIKVAKSTP